MRPHVLIIGCGFGGLEAARALRAAAVDITVVDKTNHHLFQPLLYQVATAGLSAPSIAAPIRHLFRAQRNVTTLMGEVVAIDAAARTVSLKDGAVLHWDHLIVAAGATHSYFGRRRLGALRARPEDAGTMRSRSAAACCSPSSRPSARTTPPGARR